MAVFCGLHFAYRIQPVKGMISIGSQSARGLMFELNRFALLLLVIAPQAVLGQSKAHTPNLSETLQWLDGVPREESGYDAGGRFRLGYFEFDSKSCDVTLTEHRRTDQTDKAVFVYSFALGDIDPSDIHIESLNSILLFGDVGIRFHTRNHKNTINHSGLRVSHIDLITTDHFASRFKKGFKHAIELCGGKPSSY
jgi:hypothetical protein